MLTARWLVALASISTGQVECRPDGQDSHSPEATAAPDLSALSDEELERHYRESLDGRHPYMGSSELDACLLEMVRRKGRWAAFLGEELERERATAEPADLGILTALRRIQGKCDPLTIHLEEQNTIEAEFPELPVLGALLQNVDEDGESFHFTDGGDYRTGRLERWRVEAIGSDGCPARVRKLPPTFGGGFLSREVMKSGESWGTLGRDAIGEWKANLPLNIPITDYVELDPWLTYTILVQYHDQMQIAELGSTKNLMVHSSRPLQFRWKPRTIRLSGMERSRADGWIAGLRDHERVVVYRVPYRDDMEFEGEPSQPFDGLYRMGWKALPSLLDALERDDNPSRRAWYLATLFSITGLVDPTLDAAGVGSALGSYRFVSGPRSAGSGGSAGGSGTVTTGPPNPDAQQPLIEKWRSLRDLLRVESVD
jgi:hypothetical protein